MGPLTTPKKVGDGRSMDPCDPWTPTSNLKILISAASPDIRNREKELCKDASEVQDAADVNQVCVCVLAWKKARGQLCRGTVKQTNKIKNQSIFYSLICRV